MKKGFIGQRSTKINIGGNTAKSPTFIPTANVGDFLAVFLLDI